MNSKLTDVADDPETASTDGAQLDHTLRVAIDAAADSIMVHRPDGTLVYWNAVAAQNMGLEGVAPSALEPWTWTSAPPAERQERLKQLSTQGHLRFTCRNRKSRDGHVRHVEVSSAWIETDDGPLIISIERDVSERTQAERALRDMAFRDPLTGLANRAMLEDRLKLAVANAQRHHDVLGVLFIDLDDFKPVNDTYGHAVGDAVLRKVAKRMLQAVREEDTVARVGGDEFVVVLPRLRDELGLLRAAKKLLTVIDDPFELGGETYCCVTASIGHALFDPEHDDAHTLLIRADLAMYHARQTGMRMTGAEPLD